MYAKSVRVSLKGEHGFDTVTLAKAIHGFSPIALSTCITIARALLSGPGMGTVSIANSIHE